jgi:hypothetical protein
MSWIFCLVAVYKQGNCRVREETTTGIQGWTTPFNKSPLRSRGLSSMSTSRRLLSRIRWRCNTLQFPCLYTATRQKIQDSPKTRDSLVNHLCLLSQTAPSTRIKRHRARRWGLGRRGLGWDWGKSQSPLADRARQQIIPPTRHPRLPLDARRTTVALLDNNLPPSALSPVRKVPERESADGARGGASERYLHSHPTRPATLPVHLAGSQTHHVPSIT